LSQRRC